MKYIINLVLFFDSNTRMLALKNDDTLSMELSKPANRLLCELIINNNITLAREDIIKKVWADYGFSTSVATLNNNISELRKAFSNLGFDREIIVTVPKIGFRMEAEIHPANKKDKLVEEMKTEVENVAIMDESSPQINEHVLSPSEDQADKVQKQSGPKTSVLVAGIGILVTAVTVGITLTILLQSEVIRPVTTIGKCSIHSLSNTPTRSNFIEHVQDMIKKKKVDCNNEPVEIYYTDTRQGSNVLTVRFMAVCYPIDDGHYQNCENYKIVR
ncbi:transcriptional regulator [Serratia sp. J2]|uniref:transcriptional regulator n=1 Tax=Serratia sp. J2 TaxID=3386551 RepID=UPI003916EA11